MRIIALLLFGLGFFTINAQKYGYATLIAPQNATTASLLDTNSNVVKLWSGLNGKTAYSSHLMPGGYLWRSVSPASGTTLKGGGIAGRVQKVDWNGTILFDYTISSATECSHHDFCPLPNGNVLMIVYEVKTAAEVAAAGCSANAARWSEKIVELKPTGVNTAEIVWQWKIWDHLVQSVNPSLPNYQTSIVNHPELLNINYKNTASDWIHMNGIDYNEELDQIVVSSHNLNELWIIDHSTTTAQAASHIGGKSGKGGDILYRWGNPAAYGATGTQILKVVHDAHWIPKGSPNAGYLAAFNNQGVSTNQSSVDVVNPPRNGTNYDLTLGQAYTPASYTYRHACSGYSSNMGSSDQLPNGNTLVSIATQGKVYEVNSSGTILWTYTGTGSIPQAHRHSKCFIENPDVAITNVNPTLSAGSSLQLTTSASATGVTNFSYQWFPSTGLSSTSIANPTVSGLNNDITYTVVLNTGSCTDTAKVTVKVLKGGLNVSVSAIDSTLCEGEATQLFAKVTGGDGNYSYTWSSDNNTFNSTSKDPFINPTTTTTYSVTVKDGSNNSGSASLKIIVNPLPAQPTITMIDSLLKSSSLSGNQWFYYGAPIEGDTNQYFHPIDEGAYQVQVIDKNGCASLLSDPFEYKKTAIQTINFNNWVIFPNPASDQIFINGDNSIANFTVKVIDQIGTLKIKELNPTMLSLTNLPSGLYLISIEDGNQRYFEKLLITK